MMNKERMTVYIAGPITGEPNYKQRFDTAEKFLRDMGHIPMNPAWLPSEGFKYKDYIGVSQAMLMPCDAIYMLEGWTKSEGAVIEYNTARYMGKKVYYEGCPADATNNIAIKCQDCDGISIFSERETKNENNCLFCGSKNVIAKRTRCSYE